MLVVTAVLSLSCAHPKKRGQIVYVHMSLNGFQTFNVKTQHDMIKYVVWFLFFFFPLKTFNLIYYYYYFILIFYILLNLTWSPCCFLEGTKNIMFIST